MKKIIYLLFCLPVFLLNPVRTGAQETCNSLGFTIQEIKVTDATCLSNGKIEVTISDATSNISYIEYGLTSVGGFTVTPREGNVFENLPPGTYTVSARAFCSEDASVSVVHEATNVVVGGNYQVPQASFNAANSRKSYSGTCGTGRIALNVTGGSGNFTFNVVASPGGATTGPVTPTKSGTLYTLPGEDWPAGTYQISVDDGCYTAMANFTLDALNPVTGFPTFQYEDYTGFRPDYSNTYGSCNYAGWNAYSNDLVVGGGTYNSDYAAYFNAGMYEIGMAPTGTNVNDVTNWKTWTANSTSSYLFINLSPNSISDFYPANSITVFLRVKDCSAACKSFTAYIKKPNTLYPPTVGCDFITVKPWNDYDGFFCYPLTLSITAANGDEIYRKEGWQYNTDNATQIPFTYDAGTYTITFTDANGTAASYTATPSYSSTFFIVPYCNYYSPYLYVTSLLSKPLTCYSWTGIVTVTDDEGTVIGTATVYNSGIFNLLSDIHMEYGKNYTVRVDYPNGIYATYTKNIAAIPAPTITIYSNSDSYCNVNNAYFYISISSAYFPVGTTLTVTGTEGYTSQSYKTSSLTNYGYFPSTTLPPGSYTLTYDYGDGDCQKTVTINNPGIYNYKDFGYTSERTCSGLKITPTGNITYQGNNTNTYFRLTGGPAGYDQSVISPGGSLTLSTPGTYTLDIQTQSGSGTCAMATQTIEYAADPLSFDVNFTSAYVCVGDKTGNISVKAINGVPPYKYELWDDGYTDKIDEIDSDGSAHFIDGVANATYTVHVSDQCGSNFNQKVTLSDLSTPRIVYAVNNTVCPGGSIELKCITLGTTEYSWTGPNGYTSNEQNPTRENADETMTGWYTVNVTPEFCGEPVTDQIYITVLSLTAAGETGDQDQEICVLTAPSILNNDVTGGSGDYTYQWQTRADGVAEWADIPEATETTYQPPVTTKLGTFYYRCITTDASCGSTFTGDAIAIVVKGCYVPVNPNIRSLPLR